MARTSAGARTLAGARTATTARDSVNVNLVPNPGFEIAPTFVAATNTQAKWIDGTAAGNTAKKSTYGWGVLSITGSGQTQFDSSTSRSGTNSLKVSITATGSDNSTENVIATTLARLQESAIPILPSTAYTITGWMKTNYVSGDSSDGAFITTQERNGAGSGVGTPAVTTKVKTTTDWTQYSVNFTTNSAATMLQINLRVRGNTGTATLIMDAWYDSIELRQVTSPTRGVA